jgi:hypothetical protein
MLIDIIFTCFFGMAVAYAYVFIKKITDQD